MRQLQYILLLFFISSELIAQKACDTIKSDTSEVIIGGFWAEKFMAFEDFDSQMLDFYASIDFRRVNSNDSKVYVFATFSKDGKIRNTRIGKSSGNNYLDSIAFEFVNNLDNWLPGLTRGRFIDIDYAFPIFIPTSFDSTEYKKSKHYGKSFLTVDPKEYNSRKEYFDFLHSGKETKILTDFSYFSEFVVENIKEDSVYTYLWEYRRPKRKDLVKVDFGIEKSDSTSFLIIHSNNLRVVSYIPAKERTFIYWDWGVQDNFTPSKRKGTLYLDKNETITLIGFRVEKNKTKLALEKNISFLNDTVINLDFREFKKNELINELKYSP